MREENLIEKNLIKKNLNGLYEKLDKSEVLKIARLNKENRLFMVRHYIIKYGPISAIRVSIAKSVIKDDKQYYYYDIVPYIIKLNNKNKVMIKALGKANKKYTSFEKAERIAKEIAKRENLFYIEDPFLNIYSWFYDNILDLLKFIENNKK
jgi:hypothetical protein